MLFNKALLHTVGWKSLNTAFTFFINLLMVRLLGSETSGSFFYAIAVLSFLALLIGLCLENGIIYYASSKPESSRTISMFVLFLLAAQALLSWLILQFFAVGIDKNLALLFIASNLAINYFSALYVSKKWFIAANIIACAVNFSVLVLLGLVYHHYEPAKRITDSSTIFIGAYFLQALLLLLFYFFFSKKYSTAAEPALPVIKSIFIFSGIVYLSNLLFFLVTRVDYYFVEKSCTTAALSNYIQASKMAQLLLLLPVMVGSVIFPYTSGGDVATMAAQTKRACRLLSLLFFVAAALIAATGYWVFPWMFGKGFTQMYVPVLLLLPGILCLTLLAVISAYLDGIKRIWLSVWANIAALFVIAIADWFLIPLYGINAAALISSAGYFVCAAVPVYWFCKLSGSSVGELFVFRRSDLKG